MLFCIVRVMKGKAMYTPTLAIDIIDIASLHFGILIIESVLIHSNVTYRLLLIQPGHMAMNLNSQIMVSI